MLRPHAWFDALRIQQVIKNYPVYSPPITQNEIDLPLIKAKENFAFFKQNIAFRMEVFRALLKRFSISATTNDQDLAAVSEWFDRYGGLLRYYRLRDTSTLNAFVHYDPRWIGRYIGINVIWDIGIYVGECIIARRRYARWDINTGDPDPLSCKALGFHRPHIEGLSWPPSCDPITHVFDICHVMCRRVRFGPTPPTPPVHLLHLVALWSKSNLQDPEQAV